MPKYKKRKDGRYNTTIVIGCDEKGKPKKKSLYGRTINELDEKVVEFKSLLNKGIICDDKNLTLGEWAKHWLANYRGHVTERTLQKDKLVVEKHIKSLAHLKLRQLKPHHFQQLINQKAEEGMTGHLRYLKLTIKAILKQAVANDFILKNPMDNVTIPAHEPKQRRALYDYERTALENADLSLKERAFTSLCLYAGLRRGEALALTKSDIDFKENTINVNKTVVYNDHMPSIKNCTKTKAGQRVVPLVEPLRTHLLEHMKTVKGIYIFDCRTCELVTKTSYENLWEMVIKKMNATLTTSKNVVPIKGITAHYLRHTYATDIYYAGVDIKTCQYLLGHNSIQVTMDIYAHFEIRNDNLKDKLENYLKTSKKVSSKNA